jgi:hypothetical protein
MLTYYAPTAHSKTNSYWLRTAIHFARNCRADRYNDLDSSEEIAQVLKKLWWCCILRDRIMSLSLRRPLELGSMDFNYTLSVLNEMDFQREMQNSKVYDPMTKRALALLLGSLCELAVVLTGVLEALYPVWSSAGSDKGLLHYCTLDCSSLLLDRWYERTSAKFQIFTQLPFHQSLTLFLNMIYIYYQ